VNISDEKYTEYKKRKKFIKIFTQLIVIFIIIFICVNIFFDFRQYKPYTEDDTSFAGDKGFIALSYFGVDRVSRNPIIGVERLESHLKALKDSGYVTVTQDDVLEYYSAGKILPAKSLLLLFEDGRRDTAVFSEKMLAGVNFKATILNYSETFDNNDTKFLRADELLELEKSTFWEIGTNGYRLYFINVFDRYNRYLGELSPIVHAAIAPVLGRKYNHYLMDFIRDKDGYPKESYRGMRNRINYEYEKLRDIYQEKIHYIPRLYILMHSNTGSFGNNDSVSAINAYWIKSLFKMNINREGFSHNSRNSSIYDLTRMQPQAYWHANHLLMRVREHTGQDVKFIKGAPDKHGQWEKVMGELEVDKETLVLTSLPRDAAIFRLKGSGGFQDLSVATRLLGNRFGRQSVYMRADDTLEQFLSVSIFNNHLYISEKINGEEKELFKLDLDKHDGKEVLSVAEDRKAAMIIEMEAFIKYADNFEDAKIYAERLRTIQEEKAPDVEEGEPEFVPALSIHTPGDRMLEIHLKGNSLDVKIDEKYAVSGLTVANAGKGHFCLESQWGGKGWSQRNITDSVYDGVFERLIITDASSDDGKILFDSRLDSFDALKLRLSNFWENLISWFIRNL
jgi:hypothetical protein